MRATGSRSNVSVTTSGPISSRATNGRWPVYTRISARRSGVSRSRSSTLAYGSTSVGARRSSASCGYTSVGAKFVVIWNTNDVPPVFITCTKKKRGAASEAIGPSLREPIRRG